jgi:hypothetical protein
VFTKDFPFRYELDNGKVWMVGDDGDRTVQLQEVTVVATKVKMVMKGDTIVYDASAFQVAEGSMLDALISQLPGTKLSNDGRITVNGEFISSLLVDGNEFFQGDPNVALRNLPAYTVKNVQVYHKDEELMRFGSSDKSTWELPLVMDVRLKPQYHKGFIGNMDGGYGTNDRYYGRVFGMEYARRGRVAAYGAINNVNNETAFQGGGTWGADRVTTGERRVAKGGIDFRWANKWDVRSSDRAFEMTVSGNAIFTHSDVDITAFTTTTEFLPTGSQYVNSSSISHSRDNRVSSNLYWTVDVPIRNSMMIYFQGHPNFNYSRGHNSDISRSARFSQDPAETGRGAALDSVFSSNAEEYGRRTGIIYRNSYDASGQNQSLSVGDSEIQIRFKKRGSQYNHQYCAYVKWNYNHNSNSDLSTRLIDYSELGSSSTQNLRKEAPSTNWYVNPSLRQIFELADMRRLTVYEGFTHNYSHGIRNVYEITDPFASLSDAIRDATNSYYSHETVNRGYIQARYKDDIEFSDDVDFVPQFSIETGLTRKHLRYERGDINTSFSRNWWTATPDASLSLVQRVSDGKVKYRYTAAASMTMNHPSMVDLLETTDNVNPLNIYKGNPNLKTSYTLNTSIEMAREDRVHNRMVSIDAAYHRYYNRRAQFMTYDMLTGVSTYMPVNVDGAYTVGGGIDFTSPLDSDNRAYISTGTSANYSHIPDWMSTGSESGSILSLVHNVRLRQSVDLSWKVSPDHTLSLGISGAWRHITSPSQWFANINAGDITAKLGAQLRLPWQIECNTELNCAARTGYGDESLNGTDWVWNIMVQRSFHHGAFTVRAEAFDLLNQLNSVATDINSLGRTETWTNSLHRYVMFSLAWKFSLMPSSGASR